jgi:hypothetical protein
MVYGRNQRRDSEVWQWCWCCCGQRSQRHHQVAKDGRGGRPLCASVAVLCPRALDRGKSLRISTSRALPLVECARLHGIVYAMLDDIQLNSPQCIMFEMLLEKGKLLNSNSLRHQLSSPHKLNTCMQSSQVISFIYWQTIFYFCKCSKGWKTVGGMLGVSW